MEEIKNPFSFGTGNIDKDQWLRDIDNEQEDFITRYGGATNKHRTALLRQAFQDLRARIASGDMLNRTADGQYQFGSALNRDDKHMQEAYQRALGFMGNLARRQISTPIKPEEKKYGTTTLQQNWLKYLNPSGKFNEKAYWAEGDDASRIAELKKFLEQEKNGLGAYTGYEGYKDRADLESRIQAFLDSPTERNLQRLGFDNRNWITRPIEETPDSEQKSELQQVQEQIAAQQEAQQVQQGRQYLNYNNNKGTSNYDLSVSNYDFNEALNKYLGNTIQATQAQYFNPQFSPSQYRAGLGNEFISKQQQDLDNYFKNFATSWRPNYESGDNNRKIMQNYLSKLFATYNKGTNPDGTPISDYAFDWKKYFTQIGQNQFLINGSLDSTTGRYAYYVPGEGIRETSILDTQNPYVAQQLGYTIPSQKEGGKIEFLQQGGGFDFEAWDSANNPQQPVQKPTAKKQIESENSQFSNSETARIAATIADITSMGTAFVPGYGTAISAVLGLGSTVTNFGADLSDGVGLWDATKNAGFGLAADVMGLIPGLGGAGKGAKIARNLMWAVPKMLQWVNTANGLANAGEIKNSITKLATPSSMSVKDWQNVSQALQIMTGHGRSIATKVKKAGMTKTTTTTEPEYYIYTNKGKQKVSDETFKRLREAKGTKARQALTEELMGQGVTLNQTRFAPWNTSTRFGAFKEVPGRTTMEVQNKHKGWFSDENLVQKAENANPSVDIRGILTRINPYRAYYSGRNQPVVPKRDYSKLSIFPADSPLNIYNTTPKVQPHPTGEKYTARSTEQPKAQPKNNPQPGKKHKKRKHEIGGILYALRNGGIIKAQLGLSSKYTVGDQDDNNPMGSWGNLNWGTTQNNSFKDYLTAGYNQRNGITWSRGLWGTTDSDQDMFSAYNAQRNYYTQNDGNNIMGDVKNYFSQWIKENEGKNVNDFIQDYNSKVDRLRELNKTKIGTPANTKGPEWDEFNSLHHKIYPSYGLQSDGRDDWSDKLKDILGESTWRRIPNSFNGLSDLQDKRSAFLMGEDPKWQVAMDNEGHLIIGNTINPNNDIDEHSSTNNDSIGDSEGERATTIKSEIKNPFDPTLLTIAGKTLLGLRGNRDIYGNLLKEMPQAPLRDPIDRKLAIVGWQEQIKQGQNQLADLRNIYGKQVGSDAQVNLAGALEVEGKGRDIMNDKFMKDSERQFATAQRSWDLDNDDYLRNNEIYYQNDKARKDRARMMAQIRAAWRSGDNNILMGALSDASNWWLKKYQREQDLVDKAKELSLGTPEEQAQAALSNDTKYSRIMDKHVAGQPLTDEERAYIRRMQAEALKGIRGKFASSYYNMYHIPGFGGGYKETIVAKDGTKLEVAKLKARSKDNDRYVSMIKDLRQSSRRRRRR